MRISDWSSDVCSSDLLRLDRPGGVIVSDIYDGGPADRAGIAAGDVVVTVDGQPVNDLQSLRYRVATGALGDALELGVVRDGRLTAATLPLENGRAQG